MTFKAAIGLVIGYINILIPVVFALTLLAFLWGVFRYVFASGSEDGLKKGREVMFWGILVLAIMVSAWGILDVLRNTILEAPSGSSTNPTQGGIYDVYQPPGSGNDPFLPR